MIDLACMAFIEQVAQKLPDPVVSFAIGDTRLNRDGQYDHINHVITVHHRVCTKPRFYLKWVVLHELGHHIAVSLGDTSEVAADYYAKKWYGDTEDLVTFSEQLCKETESILYCYIAKEYK